VSLDSPENNHLRTVPFTETSALQYSVWRRDDNGNIFLVKDGLNKIDALRIARELQDKGHKQSYWVKEIP